MNLKRPIETLNAKKILLNIANNGPLSLLAVNQFPRLAQAGIEFDVQELPNDDPYLKVELLDGKIIDIPLADAKSSSELFAKLYSKCQVIDDKTS